MLAKATIYAGISVSMAVRKVSANDINNEVFIAGSFGNHVDPENAKIIGMIPNALTEKIRFVGNTAVMGADMVLLSKDTRKKAEEVARKVKY